MFVTYPQSGNGQRQVMSDHRRNMFLSFHLVVVSRDPRARVSLSLSQAIGSRNNMLLRSDGCFPSVCETFQRVSQRGYISPFVLQGPNLGNLVACVLLMNNATMPSFIHSYITCQTSRNEYSAARVAFRPQSTWQRGLIRALLRYYAGAA